ncbi:uncharacterized protein EV422DRAFT_518560 [Fimicolochytrium jonesii]|uniref:uncharacterized protein n=1 Tax=Fimicolochytrium jonesii TaxID=1396493 RepID=UPI0022FDD3A2|nr:uncharacterized protein EV422DRAFT_518560 [Fimicolochytrium jonesii]KAI8823999.1 hypothetical protein EV422DRAFT_518560 [Fimicolochytrium jonesii]
MNRLRTYIPLHNRRNSNDDRDHALSPSKRSPPRRRITYLLFTLFGFLALYLLSHSVPQNHPIRLRTNELATNVKAAVGAGSKGPDTLVVYVYYDGVRSSGDPEPTYKGTRPIQNENIEFFLKHGLQSNVDILFVLNSPLPSNITIPEHYPNIYVWQKENACYDLGSFKQGVERMRDVYKKTYIKYLVVNASVRGPFLPTYAQHSCWADLFTSRLSSTVKMVGTTYNCDEWFPKHVQSMLLAFDQVGYDAAIGPMDCPKQLSEAITTGEIRFTDRIHEKGYQVDAVMSAFHGIKDFERVCNQKDVNFPNLYFGRSLHPYEVVFIKSNRNIDDHILAQYTSWHNNMRSRCPYHIE